MEKELLNQIIARYQQGTASPDEIQLIERYYSALEHRSDPEGKGMIQPDEGAWAQIKNNIDQHIQNNPKPKTYKL